MVAVECQMCSESCNLVGKKFVIRRNSGQANNTCDCQQLKIDRAQQGGSVADHRCQAGTESLSFGSEVLVF